MVALFLFLKGMTGALAPFSYLVCKEAFIILDYFEAIFGGSIEQIAYLAATVTNKYFKNLFNNFNRCQNYKKKFVVSREAFIILDYF